MKNFTYKHSYLTIARQVIAKTLPVCLGMTMITSAVLSITTYPALSQKSSQELTKPTQEVANPILQKLLGTWQVQSSMQPEGLSFIFAPDGKLFLYSSQQKKGMELGYSLDTSKKPIHVDILLKEEGLVKTIAELTADGKLKMQIEDTKPGNQRPVTFAENATILEQVSQATSLPKDVELVENKTAKPR